MSGFVKYLDDHLHKFCREEKIYFIAASLELMTWAFEEKLVTIPDMIGDFYLVADRSANLNLSAKELETLASAFVDQNLKSDVSKMLRNQLLADRELTLGVFKKSVSEIERWAVAYQNEVIKRLSAPTTNKCGSVFF